MESTIALTSLIATISSIALAVAAIGISESAERESRENSQKTKEALAEIDKKPAVIEGGVTKTQRQLLDTVTSLLKETATPAKTDAGEQMGLAFMQTLLTELEKGDQTTEELSASYRIVSARRKPE